MGSQKNQYAEIFNSVVAPLVRSATTFKGAVERKTRSKNWHSLLSQKYQLLKSDLNSVWAELLHFLR